MSDLPEPGPAVTFRRDPDGTVWALDPFPEVLAFSRELLELEQDGPHLRVRGDLVEISAQNASCVYRILGWRDGGATAIAQLEAD